MANFATVDDMVALYRALTAAEQTRAQALLPVVSDRLRVCAQNVGRDLDKMIETNPHLATVAKSVTVDVVARILQTPTEGAPMSQFSESALGYTQSGTFLSPGGGVFIKKSELQALGLTKPKFGAIDLFGEPND